MQPTPLGNHHDHGVTAARSHLVRSVAPLTLVALMGAAVSYVSSGSGSVYVPLLRLGLFSIISLSKTLDR